MVYTADLNGAKCSQWFKPVVYMYVLYIALWCIGGGGYKLVPLVALCLRTSSPSSHFFPSNTLLMVGGVCGGGSEQNRRERVLSRFPGANQGREWRRRGMEAGKREGIDQSSPPWKLDTPLVVPSLPPSSIAVCLSCLPSLNPVKIVNFSIHLRPLNVFSWSNAVGVLCVVAFLCSYFFSQPVFEQHYYSFLLRASLSPPPKRERSSFEQAGMSSFLGGLAGIARRRQLLVVGWLVA